jgi:hypothetical protein
MMRKIGRRLGNIDSSPAAAGCQNQESKTSIQYPEHTASFLDLWARIVGLLWRRRTKLRHARLNRLSLSGYAFEWIRLSGGM